MFSVFSHVFLGSNVPFLERLILLPAACHHLNWREISSTVWRRVTSTGVFWLWHVIPKSFYAVFLHRYLTLGVQTV